LTYPLPPTSPRTPCYQQIQLCNMTALLCWSGTDVELKITQCSLAQCCDMSIGTCGHYVESIERKRNLANIPLKAMVSISVRDKIGLQGCLFTSGAAWYPGQG
jgi:hypothetical protein